MEMNELAEQLKKLNAVNVELEKRVKHLEKKNEKTSSKMQAEIDKYKKRSEQLKTSISLMQ